MKLSLFFTTLLCLLAVDSVFAQTNREYEISNSFVEQALRAEQGRDNDQAVNYFSRALLLDPYIETAQENLIQLSRATGLTPKRKLQLILFRDLVGQIENLRGRIDYYLHKKELLSRSSPQLLNERGFSQIGGQNSGESIETGELNEGLLSKTNDPMELLNLFLKVEKDKLAGQLKIIKNSYEKAAQSRQTSSAGTLMVNSRKTNYYTQNFYKIHPDLTPNAGVKNAVNVVTPKKPEVNYPSSELSLVKKELALVHKKMAEFQKILSDKDEKIKDMSSQIIDLSMQLTEKQQQLEENKKSLVSVNENLEDLRSRFDLGQKIITEKNNQIATLQNQLDESQQALIIRNDEINKILFSKDEKLLELHGITNIYKGKLKDSKLSLQEKIAYIMTMEDQLMLVQKKLITKDQLLKEARQKIESLRVKVFETEERLLRVQKNTAPAPATSIHSERNLKDLRSELDKIHNFLNNQMADIQNFDEVLTTNR